MSLSIRAIIAAILLIANSIAFADPHYAIIVDAGSSGSRLHLFKYEQEAKLPIIEEIFTDAVKPGLSSFADHPKQAAYSLKILFDHAEEVLKAKQINPHTVSVSVLATAGMRLLPREKTDEIYHAVRTYLKKHYAFTIEEVATIPEKMEGVYGWLNLNYIGHSFNEEKDTTVGAIDMGGASTEITFSTQDTSKPDDEVNLTINGVNYTIFSKSFLGLGLNQARAAIANQPQENNCYPTHYTYNGTEGNFNQASCHSLYADLLQQHRVAKQLLPIPSQQTFVANSGIYNSYHFLDIDKHPSQAAAQQKIEEICTLSWDQLKEKYKNIPPEYLANDCNDGVYVTAILFDAYQLQASQLVVTTKINGQDLDWALGALLWKSICQSNDAQCYQEQR